MGRVFSRSCTSRQLPPAPRRAAPAGRAARDLPVENHVQRRRQRQRKLERLLEAGQGELARDEGGVREELLVIRGWWS